MTDFSLFKTYGTTTPEGHRSNDHRLYFIVFSEQWFDSWPQQLIDGGMTCLQAREYIAAHWQSFPFFDEEIGEEIQVSRVIVKRESIMAACAALSGTSTGGLFQTQIIPDESPIVEVGGVSYPGACTPTPNYPVDGTWGMFRFQSFVGADTTWLPVVEAINSLDINKWFCNVTSCCGTGIPIGGGSAFLIPGADMPSPVQQNSSVPLIKTPVYLANHTWAFKNNFGRLPK